MQGGRIAGGVAGQDIRRGHLPGGQAHGLTTVVQFEIQPARFGQSAKQQTPAKSPCPHSSSVDLRDGAPLAETVPLALMTVVKGNRCAYPPHASATGYLS
jgi:hypothetical protein